MALLAMCCVIMAGCYGTAEKDNKKDKDAKNDTSTTAVSLDKDICAMCGNAGCDGESCPADAEKCSCGFHKGSELCCIEGLKPIKGVYCKSCGQMKGSDECCKEGAETCSCGLHEGAPLCCKLKDKDNDHGHDHDGDDHDHDHDGEGHDKDGEDKDGDEHDKN